VNDEEEGKARCKQSEFLQRAEKLEMNRISNPAGSEGNRWNSTRLRILGKGKKFKASCRRVFREEEVKVGGTEDGTHWSRNSNLGCVYLRDTRHRKGFTREKKKKKAGGTNI